MTQSEFKELAIYDKKVVIINLVSGTKNESLLQDIFSYIKTGSASFIKDAHSIAKSYLSNFEQQLSKEAAKTYLKIHINNMCNVDNIQKYNNELTLSQSMIVAGFVREIIENY